MTLDAVRERTEAFKPLSMINRFLFVIGCSEQIHGELTSKNLVYDFPPSSARYQIPLVSDFSLADIYSQADRHMGHFDNLSFTP